jgi:hypothetical protein
MLSENNIKSELSYGYLHLVSAMAGFDCQVSTRHLDAAGIDAVLRAKERFSDDSKLTEMSLDVQLKATSKRVVAGKKGISFSLTRDHYDKLRTTETASPRILVVLFMPTEREKWLSHNAKSLVARKCAYWTCLQGKPEITKDSTTIYIPKRNHFSTGQLREIMARVSKAESLAE